jgi:hypothetical protein
MPYALHTIRLLPFQRLMDGHPARATLASGFTTYRGLR